MIAKNDHIQWLRRQAGQFRKAAEVEQDVKKQEKALAVAERMFLAAGAFEMALAGTDPGAMGGHQGLLKRLRPGKTLAVKMLSGEQFTGQIRAMGKYDIAMLTDDGRELVIAKHALAYWEVYPEPATAGEDAS